MPGPIVSISLTNNGTNDTLSLTWSVNWNGSYDSFTKSVYVSIPGVMYNTAQSGSQTITGLTAGTSYTATITAEAYYYDFGEFLSTSGSSTATTSGGGGGSAPTWTDQTLAGFTVGTTYSDKVTASGATSYSVSSGSLPAGITLSSSTGTVSGKPTTAGSYSFTIRASNTYGNITKSFSGSVAGGVKVRGAGSWTLGTAKVWNGTAWVSAPVRVFNGTSWVLPS